jgi:hypothetical protein
MMSTRVVVRSGRVRRPFGLVLALSLVAWGLLDGLGPAAAGAGTAMVSSGSQEVGPFEGRSLYVDPYSNARREAAAARGGGDEDTARLFDRIGDRSQADWFGDWFSTGTVRKAVRDRVATITGADAYPVLVLYAIPDRDCDQYSGGGLGSFEAYLDWVREVAAGIGGQPAAVMLEPDSVALMDCLTSTQRSQRLAALREAVSILTASGEVAVYLDGGHSHWHSARLMADRLTEAGVAGARGFALNVANFRSTDDEMAYGRAVSDRLGGGAHFVVDTSRNGQGPHPDDEWCNPAGRGLGLTPRTQDTGDARADALLWIKRPGESDGECGRGEPAAGQWWADYALGLASRQVEEPTDGQDPGEDPDDGQDPGEGIVSVSSVDYGTRGGRDQDRHLEVSVSLADEDGPVADTEVVVEVVRDGGEQTWRWSGTTGRDGTLTVTINNHSAGCYRTEVVAVDADWDGATPANGHRCGSG